MRPSAAFFIASLASLLRTHAAPGDLDPSFASGGQALFSMNGIGGMAALVLQSDGKIIAAGGARIVRFLPDGTLDPDFNSGGIISLSYQHIGPGWADLAVLADGKVLACANRTLWRWHPDGSPDTSFNGTGVTALPGQAFDLTLDDSGRILVGMLSGLARYTPNGSLDVSFGQSGIALYQPPNYRSVASVASLPGGGSLVMEDGNGGWGWGVITKLDSAGVEDSGFPLVQVLVGMARMEIEGQRAIYYSSGIGISGIDFQGNSESVLSGPDIFSGAHGFTKQRDGKFIVVGGSRNPITGRTDISIRRVLPGGALDTSFATDGVRNVVTGSFQSSANRAVVQRDGKIVVAAISDTNLVVLRLLGDDPDLTVEHPLGTSLAAVPVPTIDFGPVVAGQSQTRTVYLSNRSPADLEGLKVVRGANGTPLEFSVSDLPATLASWESVPLTLILTPSSPGKKTATIEIQSNDPDESQFTLSLAGRQATATDLWRQTYFGNMDETGAAADQSDPDADGIPNLVEFAFGSHPKESTPNTGTLVRNGGTLEFTYWRSKAALGEIAFVREFSQSLAEGWSQVGGMVETILEDTTDLQKVRVNTPAGSAGRRFVRLRITRR